VGLLESPELARNQGRAARQRMIEEFGDRSAIDAHARLYRRMVHPDPAAGGSN